MFDASFMKYDLILYYKMKMLKVGKTLSPGLVIPLDYIDNSKKLFILSS